MIIRNFSLLVAAALFISLTAVPQSQRTAIDRDLEEVTIQDLHGMYAAHTYTVVEVTQWYLDRIARYDSVYKAILFVDRKGALATAAAMDAAAKAGKNFKKGPLWGIPIVIKANMSVNTFITSAGWKGYMTPGHELIARTDATVVAKLKAAGAVIIGQTNMPDFAASDTNMSSAGGRTGNAYDWRFSPGGSSGGTVTAVASNFAVVGMGTDTGNSIRMPSATSSLVGILPTRGLTSIWGIQPLDWLLDNAGPIARNVTDAATLLAVMAGEDPHDFRTKGAATKVDIGSLAKTFNKEGLKGKRFGVPNFLSKEKGWGLLMQPETRAAFMKALDELRAAGATVVIDSTILPDSFPKLLWQVKTAPYLREGADNFLRDFGTAEYHSVTEFEKTTASPIPGYVVGNFEDDKDPLPQRALENDPDAEKLFWGPQKAALAAYEEPLHRLHLDGYVYPAIQMPPNDETIPQPDGEPSSGPHSWTAWANAIGVPAVVVPGGFYSTGLPFGLEFSTHRWKDRDLLSWAFAYEQATKHRKPPVLIEKK
jgi:amidase